MTVSRCWQGWGVRVEVSGPAEMLDQLAEQVPPGGRFCDHPKTPETRFEWDESRLLWIRVPGLESSADLEQALAMEVAIHSPRHLFVHAGAVRYRRRALVLPGISRAGKSTLVEALVRRGAVYYSDEYAVFHPDGKVSPYPRRLSLRAGPGRPEPVQIQPESLGWEPEMEPVPLGWMLECRYEGRHFLQPISAGEGLLCLFSNAVAARTQAKALFHSLSRALVGVPSLRGVRSEADSAADWIMDWLST